MRLPRNRYVLRASLPVTRSGPGRRQEQVAMQTFGPHQMADLLIQIETLLAQGHIISVNPPSEPPTVDIALCADPSEATITVAAA